MKIILGADVAGFTLKEDVKGFLKEKGYQIDDIGMHDPEKTIPYYEVAAAAAGKIQKGDAEKAILFCGTGMGVAIVANKFKGVYAGVVESEFGGLHCKLINDTNVLTMGGWVVSAYRAKRIVERWLEASFTQHFDDIAGFLKNALAEIKAIENQTMK